MNLFLEQLYATGEVTVPLPERPFAPLDPEGRSVLPFDLAARRSLPGTPPPLDLEVAEWAACLLAEAARLALAREVTAAEMGERLAAPCPRPHSPAADYSADLFLRYLPDLLAWVHRLAPADPLVELLRRVGAQWPLSSVGMSGLEPLSSAAFVVHPSLRQLYVDRILAAGDLSRLHEPVVAQAARAALGAHPELAPAVARVLFPAKIPPLVPAGSDSPGT